MNLESLYRRVFWVFAPSLEASQFCRHTPVFCDRGRLPLDAALRGIVCFLSRNPSLKAGEEMLIYAEGNPAQVVAAGVAAAVFIGFRHRIWGILRRREVVGMDV
jgi:hypothetical protein